MISTTQAADRGPLAAPHIEYPSKAELEVAFQAVHKARVPRIPDVVFALRDELQGSEPDLHRAAELVAQDPVMTGQILKTINSPYFFCSTKISSVRHAVTMMGIGRLANLVTAEAIARILGARAGRSRSVWDSLLEQARLMASIARSVDGVATEEAYLLGIMQDVGCLIFADLLPDYGSEWVLSGFAAPSALIEHERRQLGVDHRVVGFLLAGTWRLPEHLAFAIYHHHDLDLSGLEDQRVRCLGAVAKLACYFLAVGQETHDTSEMVDYRESAIQELSLSSAAWTQLTDLIRR